MAGLQAMGAIEVEIDIKIEGACAGDVVGCAGT